jgi:predicted metal-dependent phosphoesterase TrpH
MLIDLHAHTKFSDGLLSVEELVKKAVRKKITALALTDHDTVEGLSLFVKTCAKYKMPAITGIELSTEIDGIELHLVGYLKNWRHSALTTALKIQQEKRLERARAIIKKFRDLGFVIKPSEEISLLQQKNVGKPQIGRAILKEKNNRDLLKRKYHWKDGLSKFIGNFLDKPGQIGYIQKHRLNSIEAIKLIKTCGGVVSLAHSDIELASPLLARKIIAKLARAGLWGLEMPHVFPKNKKHLLPLAQKYHLAITFGSDTHDGHRLGVKVKEKDWQKISYLAD